MKIIKGDLLKLADDGYFDVIVHGCNCYNNMGAGIAYMIAKKYPEAYHVDQKTKRGDKSKLGTYTIGKHFTKTNPVKMFYIINAYTQYGCNASKNIDLFEYESFSNILKTLSQDFPLSNFGFPLIGCGLAGGDKERILGMIEEFSKNIKGDVTIVEWNK